MRKLSIPAVTFVTKSYYLLTKPGIIFGNIITMAGGFALASKGDFNPLLFLATLLGLICIVASACVFNNYLDKEYDQKMDRTKNRPLVVGLISEIHALFFGSILFLFGMAFLLFFTNPLALSVALFGFLVYVIIYTLLKVHTPLSTWIGSFAGAVPPVVGYCAVSGEINLGALILFKIISMWQMPHFFAISIYRMDEYKEASIPVLPLIKGIPWTKVHMMAYIIGFTIASATLTFFHYTNNVYLIITTLLGLSWMALCLKGFKAPDDKRWARQMFFYSLIVVMVFSFTLPFTYA